MCWLNSLNMEQGIGQTAQLAMTRFILFIVCVLAVVVISTEAQDLGLYIKHQTTHCSFDLSDGDKRLVTIEEVAKDLGARCSGKKFYFPNGKGRMQFMIEVFNTLGTFMPFHCIQ